jgi:hypothetical protein
VRTGQAELPLIVTVSRHAHRERMEENVNRTLLHTGWTVRSAGGPPAPAYEDATRTPVTATVPGCVHTDLMEAGLVPDPFDADN